MLLYFILLFASSLSFLDTQFKYTFLLSSERSGSNLITKLLDSNNSICGPSPTHSIRLIAQNLNNYGNLKKEQNWNIFVSDVHDYFQYLLGELQSKITKEELLSIKSRNTADLIKYIYHKEANHFNKYHLFIKENKVYHFMPYLLNYFPDCKFIYLVRDPRETILSLKNAENIPVGILGGTRIWNNDQSNFLQNYGYLKERNRIILVKYEELIRDTKNILKEICTFLSVDYNDNMLNYYMNKNNTAKSSKWQEWRNLKKPIMKNNTDKWKNELDLNEIKYIEQETQVLMDYFGYKTFVTKKSKLDDSFIEILEQKEKKIKSFTESTMNQLRKKRMKVIETVLSRKLK